MAAPSDGPPPYVAYQAQPGQPSTAWQWQQQQQQAAVPPAAVPPPPVIAQPGQTTVVVQQQPPPVPQPPTVITTVAMPMRMTPYPAHVQCPSCHNSVTTVTYQENGGAVWLAAGVLLMMGLWLGCCLIPFCIPALKDTVHVCPVCKFTVGKHAQI
ncbi:lipopolysaccharide-induced tumor necrosis factor-alpha factor homolog [Patiria miniata]|uniref:LITAF domain-containing protein n=1 Tax=Patiria miniata TaxID=46514 RepID=A0A914AR92_PATMI|nr:lipopolysaccharide-induced tumor necrosis factor-alpha factor homolog [Patiria miniata]